MNILEEDAPNCCKPCWLAVIGLVAVGIIYIVVELVV